VELEPVDLAHERKLRHLARHGDAPQIDCLIVGADMPERVTRLAREGVTIMGHMPELRDVLDRVRLTVAPLRFGAGVKGKVLDSLAAGVPCVMTSIAAEGMALPDALAGLIAEDADGLAKRILRLHGARKVHTEAARAGKDYIRVHNSEHAVAEALRSSLAAGLPSGARMIKGNATAARQVSEAMFSGRSARVNSAS
ncbi:glycosyltransferase family 4 protein, partial [Acidomonas methanolica]|uniref:glycosyltransferase family 4 protein n=1 Tax=Acidomonas methanolica TaxID=437 RepID=UPI002119FECD